MKYSMSFAQKSAPFEMPVFIGVSEGRAVKNEYLNFLYSRSLGRMRSYYLFIYLYRAKLSVATFWHGFRM